MYFSDKNIHKYIENDDIIDYNKAQRIK